MPPASNTGAQNTLKNRVLLDWCAFTVPVGIVIQNLLMIPFDYFEELPKGANGYKRQATFSGITIQWDGQEGMGIHIEMTGKGCRTYEGLHGDVWRALFIEVKENGGHFTRIDLALDDFEKKIMMRTIESKVRRGHVRSRWRDARVLNKINLEEGVHIGRTVYFGSSSSRITARFYDKALEQRAKGVTDNIPEHWVRCEMQCRDERAEKIVQYLIELYYAPFGELVSMFLRNYLEFVNPNKLDRNKSRWMVSQWWDDFLVETGKLKLTIKPEKRDLDKVKLWLENQVAASLAMLCVDGQGKVKSLENVFTLAMDGVKKLRSKHLSIVRDSEIKKESLKAL